MNKEIFIKKRNGNLEKFSADKINKVLQWDGMISKFKYLKAACKEMIRLIYTFYIGNYKVSPKLEQN